MTTESLPSTAVEILPKIQDQIKLMADQLEKRIPEWQVQLQLIHKTLSDYPECAWKLSLEDMARIVAAFKANAQVTSFQSAKESKSGKSDPTVNAIKAAGRAAAGRVLSGDDF